MSLLTYLSHIIVPFSHSTTVCVCVCLPVSCLKYTHTRSHLSRSRTADGEFLKQGLLQILNHNKRKSLEYFCLPKVARCHLNLFWHSHFSLDWLTLYPITSLTSNLTPSNQKASMVYNTTPILTRIHSFNKYLMNPFLIHLKISHTCC